MQNLQSQIDGLNTQINSLDASIEEKNTAIAEKQKNIDEDVETLKERLCAIYMMGDASTLEILLQSESVIDMAQKVELLNIITEHDTKLIAQLTADMESIADEKAEIESEKEQVAAARTELESKGSELASVQAEAERVLEELNQSVASVQAESDRIAEEKAQASAEIDQWWKDYYAQLAAQNNSSSGSSGGSSSGSIGSGGYVSTGNFTWPVPGFTNISCGYSSGHKAIDISGGGRTIYGTPIVAADSGKVVTATYHYSYGNYVMIDHGGGYSTLYAHASSLAVSAGQTVTKGQTIAYVGSTGNSTGPHLHFEVRVNGNRQNPFNWFS
ncbi:MAG: peptidase M23 [Clostridiales bacterium]|nr:MAG: peptidase M23 [Clostridiales bacterium]